MYGQNKAIEGHIVLLGWTERTKTLVTALRAQCVAAGIVSRPLLVVAPNPDVSTAGDDRIYFVFGNPTDPDVLKHTNLEKAHLVFIPQGSSGDAAALSALLAILALKPTVRVCVEFSEAQHAEVVMRYVTANNLQNQVEVLSSEHIARTLLGYALEAPGAAAIISELLTTSGCGNRLRRIDLPQDWKARTFHRLADELSNESVILLGYARNGSLVLNPAARGQLVQSGDVIWVIASSEVTTISITGLSTPTS